MAAPMLRSADAGDADALTRLMRASAAYQGFYAGLLADYRVTPEQIARDHVVLAEQEGQLVGFYSLTLGDAPELDLLFVADSAQGSGLGRILMGNLIAAAQAQGMTEVKIVSHPPSVGFYLRQGAVQIGEKPPSGRASWARPVLMLSIPAVERGV